jgi:hypothetical protein
MDKAASTKSIDRDADVIATVIGADVIDSKVSVKTDDKAAQAGEETAAGQNYTLDKLKRVIHQ